MRVGGPTTMSVMPKLVLGILSPAPIVTTALYVPGVSSVGLTVAFNEVGVLPDNGKTLSHRDDTGGATETVKATGSLVAETLIVCAGGTLAPGTYLNDKAAGDSRKLQADPTKNTGI